MAMKMQDYDNMTPPEQMPVLLTFTIDEAARIGYADIIPALVFLITSIREGDIDDVTKWISFYAKAKVDSKYGKGTTDAVCYKVLKNPPESLEELKSIMESVIGPK